MKNSLLLILALLLIGTLSPIGIGYAIIKNNNFSKYLRDIAEGLDQVGNVIMQEAFNKWLISDGGYQFGNKDETVSSVLGKNKTAKTLTKTGRWLDSILDRMDANHSIDAIEQNP